jgi:hypothetical protein
MTIIRYIILFSIFLNIPSWTLVNYNANWSSLFSYTTLLLLIFYYLISNKKVGIPVNIIILGLLYFIISNLVDSTKSENVIAVSIKYFVLICTVQTLIRDSSYKELLIILLIGSFSIFYEILIPNGKYGRYSGFYLNPNTAGFICLIGFWLSEVINLKFFKIFLKLIFLITGLATFSRTFVLILIITILISSLQKKVNIIYIVGVFIILTIFISLSNNFTFNTYRMAAVRSLVSGDFSDNMTHDSRSDTWKKYYNVIINNLFLGNGYLKLSGKSHGNINTEGVHNTPLMILGEAGILPFIVFLFFYFKQIIHSFCQIKINEFNFLVIVSIFLYMLTNHNFFDNFIILTTSLWVNYTVNQNASKNLKQKSLG